LFNDVSGLATLRRNLGARIALADQLRAAAKRVRERRRAGEEAENQQGGSSLHASDDMPNTLNGQ
jgi:hypothetical protein